MSNRTDWTFAYSTEELLAAVAERLAYHKDRLTDWTGKLGDAQTNLKENGIDFTEVARTNTGSTSGYMQQPTFDPELMRQLTQAQQKVDHHAGLMREYERYQRAFTHNKLNERYQLTIDDLTFFGL